MNEQRISELIGETLFDKTGSKIGAISEIFLDDATNAPEWALVHTGLFGTKSNFVPLQGLTNQDGKLTAAFEEDEIKGAPQLDADDHLSESEEAELYSYYNISASREESGTLLADGGPASTTGAGQDTSGPNTDNAMTRSEEEVDVSKRRVETGKVRLRKHLVTEQRTITVPVTREEFHIETEPITDANRDSAMDGPALSEEEHELTLSEEQLDVSKHVEPKERVRLAKDTVTEEASEQVDLTKEQIDVETSDDARRS